MRSRSALLRWMSTMSPSLGGRQTGGAVLTSRQRGRWGRAGGWPCCISKVLWKLHSPNVCVGGEVPSWLLRHCLRHLLLCQFQRDDSSAPGVAGEGAAEQVPQDDQGCRDYGGISLCRRWLEYFGWAKFDLFSEPLPDILHTGTCSSIEQWYRHGTYQDLQLWRAHVDGLRIQAGLAWKKQGGGNCPICQKIPDIYLPAHMRDVPYDTKKFVFASILGKVLISSKKRECFIVGDLKVV